MKRFIVEVIRDESKPQWERLAVFDVPGPATALMLANRGLPGVRMRTDDSMERVPKRVLDMVGLALKRLREAQDALARGRDLDKRLGGDGRYEYETYTGYRGEVERALHALRAFEQECKTHAVDPADVYEQLGGFVNPQLSPAGAAYRFDMEDGR